MTRVLGIARYHAGPDVPIDWLRQDLRMLAFTVLNKYAGASDTELHLILCRSASRAGARARHRAFGHHRALVGLDVIAEEAAEHRHEAGVVVTLMSTSGGVLASEILDPEQVQLGLTLAAMGEIDADKQVSRLEVGAGVGDRLRRLWGIRGKNVPRVIEVEQIGRTA